MTDTHFIIPLALGIALALLLLFLLLRKPKFEAPADLSARLGLLEQASQGLVQAVSRNEGVMQRIEQQLRGFATTPLPSITDVKETLLHGVRAFRIGGVGKSRCTSKHTDLAPFVGVVRMTLRQC
ncbi:hypothetical protein [Ralstonia pseudosolanacearum]|uniref:hypothetical protein n=1 Tax=Ralstonia pseudosolanacearum TaxID=1310165 RepID=UPI0018D1CFAA|nr:hypothetical protein [Ralstonia pseudosolanacearum]